MAQKFPLLASLPEALNKHNHNLEARAERAHKRLALRGAGFRRG